MPKFKIEYTNPETQEREVVVKEFHDTETISALEWAQDWVYGAADKNMDYVIKEQR